MHPSNTVAQYIERCINLLPALSGLKTVLQQMYQQLCSQSQTGQLQQHKTSISSFNYFFIIPPVNATICAAAADIAASCEVTFCFETSRVLCFHCRDCGSLPTEYQKVQQYVNVCYMKVCLPGCLCVNLFVYLFVCLCVCVCVCELGSVCQNIAAGQTQNLFPMTNNSRHFGENGSQLPFTDVMPELF